MRAMSTGTPGGWDLPKYRGAISRIATAPAMVTAKRISGLPRDVLMFGPRGTVRPHPARYSTRSPSRASGGEGSALSREGRAVNEGTAYSGHPPRGPCQSSPDQHVPPDTYRGHHDDDEEGELELACGQPPAHRGAEPRARHRAEDD